MQPKRVLVTGATGMIGQAVVPALLRAGYGVRVLMRDPSLNPWKDMHVESVQGDMTDAASVERATRGMEAVVHLAARKNDEKDSATVNVDGAKNLKDACEKNFVAKIINVSTQSVKLPVKGLYGSTKEQADSIFVASSVPTITFLCSVVYGDDKTGIVGSILGFSKLPVLPVIGPGTPHYRPIHRDDLAAIIVEAVEKNVQSKTYDIGGPESISFDALVDRILSAKNMKRKHLHLPIPFAMFLARLFAFLPHPPVTKSNVLGAAADVPMNLSDFEKDFAIRPRSFEIGLGNITMQDDAARAEAVALLMYVLPTKWTPDDAVIDRYLAALRQHHLPETPTLDVRVRKSSLILGAVDSALLYDRSCVLRKKLLVAAAVAETTTQGADALLPKDRTVAAVIGFVLMALLSFVFKSILALPLFFIPDFLPRNAGRL